MYLDLCYSMPAAVTVNLTAGKENSEFDLCQKQNFTHVPQMVQDQFSV